MSDSPDISLTIQSETRQDTTMEKPQEVQADATWVEEKPGCRAEAVDPDEGLAAEDRKIKVR